MTLSLLIGFPSTNAATKIPFSAKKSAATLNTHEGDPYLLSK